ncbi:hypothetical protein CANINC_000173 [Pichia inconspicua]|uniref:Uncharacterized protein n=1 Tax=Pichia inconspicua TaxID=52247 RepID=A0A4V4NGA3_9ASCO|nr:hypothetical protein CANINC_000173 [[Candida] inconspicua]
MSNVPIIAFPEESLLPKMRVPTHPVVKYVRVMSRLSILCLLAIVVAYKYIINPAFEITLGRRFELHNFVYTNLKKLHSRLRKTTKYPPSINVMYKGKLLVDRTICSDDILADEQKQFEYDDFKRDAKRHSYNVRFSIDTADGGKKDVQLSKEEISKDLVSFTDLNEKTNFTNSKLLQRMHELKQMMSQLNVADFKHTEGSGFNDGNAEMNSLLFGVKQFQAYLEVVTSEQPRELLFKKPLSRLQIGRGAKRTFKFNYLDILNDNLNEMQQSLIH